MQVTLTLWQAVGCLCGFLTILLTGITFGLSLKVSRRGNAVVVFILSSFVTVLSAAATRDYERIAASNKNIQAENEQRKIDREEFRVDQEKSFQLIRKLQQDKDQKQKRTIESMPFEWQDFLVVLNDQEVASSVSLLVTAFSKQEQPSITIAQQAAFMSRLRGCWDNTVNIMWCSSVAEKISSFVEIDLDAMLAKQKSRREANAGTGLSWTGPEPFVFSVVGEGE